MSESIKQHSAINTIPDYGPNSLIQIDDILPYVLESRPRSILAYGSKTSRLMDMICKAVRPVLGDVQGHNYDSSITDIAPLPASKIDLILCANLLENIPEKGLHKVLTKIKSISYKAIFRISCTISEKILPNGQNNKCTIDTSIEWFDILSRHFQSVTTIICSDPTNILFVTWETRLKQKEMVKRSCIASTLRTIEQLESMFVCNVRTSSEPPEWCEKTLVEKFLELRNEFTDKPEACLYHAYLIVLLRRKIDIEENFERFKILWRSYSRLTPLLNSRWLIAALDTFADHGTNQERAQAIMVSSFFNLIKLVETERLATGDLAISPDYLERQSYPEPLWDGMTTYLLKTGDMPRNMFQRMGRALESDPIFSTIFKSLLERARKNDTILRRLSRINPNFCSL